MTLFFRLISIFILFVFSASGQELPLGAWRVHLPYLKATKVTEAGNKIFCVADKGLFYYDKQTAEIGRLSKVDGLSDNDVSLVRHDNINHVTLVAYSNANIDLLYDNHDIINIPDISRANITGNSKAINEIIFYNNFAYLACGFGIVVLDLNKKEIKETYYLGATGTKPAIFDLAIDDLANIYAVSDSGIYIASINNTNLVDFSNWSKIFTGGGIFKHAVFFSGKLLVSENFASQAIDTIWSFQGGNWTVFSGNHAPVNALKNNYGNLVITYYYYVKIFDSNFQLVKTIDNVVFNSVPLTNDGLQDKDKVYWMADDQQGLVRYDGENTPDFIVPNGPKSVLVSGYATAGDYLWVSHGPVAGGGILYPYGFRGVVSSYHNGSWFSFNKQNTNTQICNMDSMTDISCVAVDPNDFDHVYAGSYGRGVIEFNDGDAVALYNNNNTGGALQIIASSDQIRVGCMALDNENRLWVGTGSVANLLAVKKTDNTWIGYSLLGVVNSLNYFGGMVIDDYNQKWCINQNQSDSLGIFVFNDNNTLEDITDDQYRSITSTAGRGGLPSKDVRAMVKDRDGAIWIGTAKGVAVFYSPGSVFSGGNYDAQQILIQYGGYNQYLLESEIVTAIAVDGANRKWFGTQNGGVFLMSADGTKQLANFNVSNSPILSNNILRISINKKTGEVFFGTDKGIISYRGTATEGEEGCADTYVYPNPVDENYEGPIAIKGLAANSNVKITDISGTVIYETKAQGGQAIWYGRSLNGEKAHTGVYLVYCSDEKGSNTCVTKMVFIN